MSLYKQRNKLQNQLDALNRELELCVHDFTERQPELMTTTIGQLCWDGTGGMRYVFANVKTRTCKVCELHQKSIQYSPGGIWGVWVNM